MRKQMSPAWSAVLLTVGLILHLLVGIYYLGSGLLVPPPAAVLLMIVWIVLLAVGILKRRQPLVVLSIPFLAAMIWYVFVAGGGLLFGWTA